MRVDKSELDDSVVEDGETAIISKSEAKAVSARKQAVNGVPLKNSPGEESQNTPVIALTKKREPVEDTDEAEFLKGDSGEVDALAADLGSCTLSADSKPEDDLEKHLAGLSVEDDGSDNENKEPKSLGSVITVDPPSLPHEEEEERCDSSESLLDARGPTAGKPVSFRPDQDGFNRIAGKAYSGLSFERFHQQQAAPLPLQFQSQQLTQPVYGFPQGDVSFSHFGMVSGAPCMPNYTGFSGSMAATTGHGKRQMDDDGEEPAYKYMHPVQEQFLQQPSLNDLSMGGTSARLSYAPLSKTLDSGGQVTDNSPDILSPAQELTGISFPPKFETQFSIGDMDSMLEALSAQEKAAAQPALTGKSVTDYDPGYTSENSPNSENMGSPGSSPKPVFSPQRPPSNMSHDSGIASPFSEESMQTILPSPASDVQNGGARNTSSPQAGGMPSQTPSASPWMPDSVMDEFAGQYPGTVRAIPAPYLGGPPSVVTDNYSAVASPIPCVVNDDHSMMSAPSPANGHTLLDSYFSEHRDDLKDALDVIAQMHFEELNKAFNGEKVCNVQNACFKAASAPQTSGRTPAPCGNVLPAASPAVPALAKQASHQQPSQAETRPNKLPIPVLSKGPVGSAVQKNTPPVSVPVMVMPNAVTPPGVSNVAVTSSQPILMIPQNQAGQSIIVVVPQPQPAPKPSKPTYRPIQPKMPSSSSPSPTDPTLTAKTEVTATKSGPIVHTTPSSSVNGPLTPASPAGVQPSSGMRPPSAQSPSEKKSCQQKGVAPDQNNQQPRMLNLARRLVAGIATDDLQFKDNEGDTYLHVSVCKADRSMVQALLERLTREKLTSMINYQNCMRQTPLYLAVSSNHPEMVELLIQYGADVNLFAEHIQADGRSKEVKAALHCAASNGAQYLRTLRALLGAPELMIDLVNSDGHTALHCAILEHGKQRAGNEYIDNLPIIQALIRHGADPNAQGKKSGKTALMYTLESRNIRLIEHVVQLIDPARLRTFLKAQAFDGSTCMRIMDNVQRDLSPEHRQRLQACFKLNGVRRDNHFS